MVGEAATAPDATLDLPPGQLALLLRQARSWAHGDFAPARTDWHPDGVLSAPRGARVGVDGMQAAMDEFHAAFRDLDVTITSAVAGPGGRLLALEWLWSASRRGDGVRSTTPDAIVVRLDEAGLILEWREYFDPAIADA